VLLGRLLERLAPALKLAVLVLSVAVPLLLLVFPSTRPLGMLVAVVVGGFALRLWLFR
jgi:predicted MFS family arabinose efflux permease